jgi:hypothetical protein
MIKSRRIRELGHEYEWRRRGRYTNKLLEYLKRGEYLGKVTVHWRTILKGF